MKLNPIRQVYQLQRNKHLKLFKIIIAFDG